MAPIHRLSAALLLVAAIGASGCNRNRHYLMLEEGFGKEGYAQQVYPRTPKDQDIRLFVNEVRRPHLKIAYVQSFSDVKTDEETKRRQLEALKSEARKVGADAVMTIRQMKGRVRGAVLDEMTPFTAYRQGRYEIHFMRGVAIKFVDEEEAMRGATSTAVIQVDPTFIDDIPIIETFEPEDPRGAERLPRGLGPAF
jgi:hypothetical protein